MLAVCRAPRTERRADGCVVETHRLASVVRDWIDRWDRDHDVDSSRERQDGRADGISEAAGPITILIERIELLGASVPQRTIYNVLAATYRHTELRTADALVAAVERPEAFHDGTLEVLPNPKATPADRASCCGGSLNGSGTLH